MLSAILIWIVSCGLSVPGGITAHLDVRIITVVKGNTTDTKVIEFCTPYPNDTTTEFYMKTIAVWKSAIYYVLPLCIIATFYALMALKLHASANAMPGELQGQSMVQVRARKHVATMVLCFVFRKYLELQ